MNILIKASIVILITALSMSGCSSNPEQDSGGYNSPDSQKSNAKHAQDELTSETAR